MNPIGPFSVGPSLTPLAPPSSQSFLWVASCDTSHVLLWKHSLFLALVLIYACFFQRTMSSSKTRTKPHAHCIFNAGLCPEIVSAPQMLPDEINERVNGFHWSILRISSREFLYLSSLSFYLLSHTWLPPGAQQTYEARNEFLLFPFLKYFHPCAQVLWDYPQQFLLNAPGLPMLTRQWFMTCRCSINEDEPSCVIGHLLHEPLSRESKHIGIFLFFWNPLSDSIYTAQAPLAPVFFFIVTLLFCTCTQLPWWCGLNLCVLLKFMLNPTPWCDDIRRWGFGKLIWTWGRIHINGICGLT